MTAHHAHRAGAEPPLEHVPPDARLVHRRAEAARRRLGDHIREKLAHRLSIAPDEVDSIVRLVQSRVELSLDRVLAPA